jgi:hypothetical protein
LVFVARAHEQDAKVFARVLARVFARVLAKVLAKVLARGQSIEYS